MLLYLRSSEFWFTAFIFALLMIFVGIGDLANYVQVTQIFAWSYIIWHLHRHHKLLKSMMEDDSNDSNGKT